MPGQQKNQMPGDGQTKVATKVGKRKRREDDVAEKAVVSDEVQKQLQNMDTPALTRHCQDLIDRNECNTAVFDMAQTLLYRRPRMVKGWMNCLDYLLSETACANPPPQSEPEKEEPVVMGEEEEEEEDGEDEDEDEEANEDETDEEIDTVVLAHDEPL